MKVLNAAVQSDGKWFVARCLDLPVTSQGVTAEEATENLAEAIELYVETWGSEELCATFSNKLAFLATI